MPRFFKDPFTEWLECQGLKPRHYQPGGIFGAPPLGWQIAIGQSTIVYRVPKETPYLLIIVLIEREKQRSGLRSPFADIVRFLLLVRRGETGITEIHGHIAAVSWRPTDSLDDERLHAFYRRHLGVQDLHVKNGVLWVGGPLAPFVPPLSAHRAATEKQTAQRGKRPRSRPEQSSVQAATTGNSGADRLPLAINLHKQGRLKEAGALYEEILNSEESPSAWQWLGTLHAQLGRHAEAMDCYARALRLDPDYAEAHSNRGNVLRALHRLDEALESYSRAIALKPDYAEAFNNRGVALVDKARALEVLTRDHETKNVSPAVKRTYLEALINHDQAILLRPNYVNAIKNRGIVLRCLGRYEEALASYDRCLQLCPDHARVLSYRGNVLHDLRRDEEAIASYQRALELMPKDVETHRHLAVALHSLRRHEEAIESCERAIALSPEDVDAHWNRAIIHLITGRYQEGWRGFEWRWEDGVYARKRRSFPQPLWLGLEDIGGKTVFVHAEGGLGDTLQFCRYAPLLLERGARVIFEVQPSLITLLREMDPRIEFISREQNQILPEFDFQVPTMSLPLAFGTTLQTIPAKLPYLHCPKAEAQKWSAHFGPCTRPRIGIACSGNRGHGDDRNRSLPMSLLAPLFQKDAEFHCIQKVIRETDREAAMTFPMRTWENDLSEFADTAALMHYLDLIITVDTSVAHLAGALGKPTWLMLPHEPDFRWLYDRDDSPWYPQVMRLFRQREPGQWQSVIDQIWQNLSHFTPA